MQRQKTYQFFDIILYLNIVVSVIFAIVGIDISIVFTIISFCFTMFNVVFLIQMIKLRMKVNESIDNNFKLDQIVEENISEDKKSHFIQAKQEILERRIAAEIKFNYPEAKIILNAMIPQSNGNYSEIDVIAILKQGIYIIEAKNITGTIIGNWKEDESFTVQHPSGSKHTIVNPLNQNTHHYYRLRDLLGLDNNLFRSIIVFGDTTKILDYRNTPYFAEVCQVQFLSRQIEKLHKRFNTVLEEHMIPSIYETLLKFTEQTDEKLELHIKRLKANEEG